MYAAAVRPASSLALVLLSGCSLFEDPPPPPPPRPPPPPPPAPIAAARAIATAAAFDLVSGPAGTFLAWGVPASDGAGVRVLELGPGGAARGSEAEIAGGSLAAGGSSDQAPNQVVELAMAESGTHLGVAWSVIVLDGLRTEAAYAATAPAFGRAVELAPMELGSSGRGNLVVAALASGELYVAHRIMRGPCHDTSGGATECARFARTMLPGGDSVRGDGASEVASPCSPFLPGALSGGGGAQPWFYGVCHGESPATTMFVINPDPASQYAAATELLAGCTPVSIARADTGAVLRARCGDDEAFARIDPMGRATHQLRRVTLTTRCDAGRPVLEAREGESAVARRLTESESRVEAWLPPALAPEGSRAVWTGEAVLVASPIGPSGGREVLLRRFECVGADLHRTDL